MEFSKIIFSKKWSSKFGTQKIVTIKENNMELQRRPFAKQRLPWLKKKKTFRTKPNYPERSRIKTGCYSNLTV